MIYVVGGYLVLWAIVDFYRNMLPLGLALSDFFTPASRRDVCADCGAAFPLFLDPVAALRVGHGLAVDRAHLGDGDCTGPTGRAPARMASE